MIANDDNRPDPEELLNAIEINTRTSKKGKLKIYLGMAAGVGKTYAMLNDALVDLKRGKDVVAGYVEAHGRAETDLLLKDFEIIPLKDIDYRGIIIREFDLDTALKRKPAIILVDELAHTNASDSRHPKRYLDIEELLAAGIDVRTTVNVQHIESLNDVVAKVTGIPVQETVPDRIFLNADEVEVVDTPPEELVERIKEGRVYKSEKIQEALRNFFVPGNLSALRELTLRQAADRVGAKAWTQRRTGLRAEGWSAKERVLVCIAPNAYSVATVREARRLASILNADLFALSVETPDYAEFSEQSRSGAVEALALAEKLGATVIVHSASEVVAEIVRVAKAERITQILIGKPPRRAWFEKLRPNFLDKLLDATKNISLHVVDIGAPNAKRRVINTDRNIRPDWHLSAVDIIRPLTVVALATFAGWPLSYYIDLTNIIMIYLVGVTWAATKHTRTQAVVTSILSVLVFDFLFVPPYFTFRVSDFQYLVTFAVMLGLSLIIADLAARLRAHSKLISEREQRTAKLYDLSTRLAEAPSLIKVSEIATDRVRLAFGFQSQLLIAKDEDLVTLDDNSKLSEKELGTALWTYRNQAISGSGTDTLPASQWLFLPLKVSQACIGVLAVKPKDRALDSTRVAVLEAFAANIALAVQRLNSEEQSRISSLKAEQAHLRGSFLSSISHDLRTPLASIEGAAAAISKVNQSKEVIDDLAKSIVDESQRLGGMIRNVLDITRLENDGIELKSDWYSLEELVGGALRRVDKLVTDRRIKISIPEDLPLVWVDGMLMEQLLVNLLENIVHHTPMDGDAEIRASSTNTEIILEIIDNGPGISADRLAVIFQPGRSLSSARQSGSRSGFGLGLSICKSIATAHGGDISAISRPGGGTIFKVALPLKALPSEVVHG